MKPSPRTVQPLIAAFALGCLLFSYPLLALFNIPRVVFGVPVLYAYLFGAWFVFIALIAALTARRG